MVQCIHDFLPLAFHGFVAQFIITHNIKVSEGSLLVQFVEPKAFQLLDSSHGLSLIPDLIMEFPTILAGVNLT